MKIQLALDFVKFKDALKVAKQAGKYMDWIEAGTPLIKSEGIRVVKELKKKFPNKKIVADLKTMDTGALEAKIAFDAGADVVSVLGVADESTIKGAINEARKRKKICMVDLINVDSKKWKKIDSLKPGYILIHVGIDQQKKGMNPLDILRKIRVKSKIVIAGGLNKDTIPKVKGKVDVIIIGGAITRAKDPSKAAKEIRAVV